MTLKKIGLASLIFIFLAVSASAQLNEGFEHDNLANQYTGDTGQFDIVDYNNLPNRTWVGHHALEYNQATDVDHAVGTIEHNISEGDIAELRMYIDSDTNESNSQQGIAFGIQDSQNNYFAVHNGTNDFLVLGKNDGGAQTTLTSANIGALPQDQWLRWVIDYRNSSSSTTTVTIYNASNDEIGSVSTTDTTFSEGGIGVNAANDDASETNRFYVDSFQKTNPVPVENWYDLDAIRRFQNRTYELQNDLDQDAYGYDFLAAPSTDFTFTDYYSESFSGSGFPYINFNSGEYIQGSSSFTGNLYGQGHTISDLYINRTGDNRVGFASEMANGAEIRNIRFENATIEGSNGVALFGGIAGISGTTLIEEVAAENIDIYASGINIGGLQGNAGAGYTLRDTYFNGTVQATPGNSIDDVGGLVGDFSGTMNRVYARGTIDGGSSGGTIGGVAGNMNGDANFSNGYAAVEINGDTQLGGFTGVESSNYAVEDGYFDENVSGLSSTGGAATALTTSEMKGSSATTSMSGLDFTTYWDTVEASDSDAYDDGYPILQNQDRTTQLQSQQVYYSAPSLSTDPATNINPEDFTANGEVLDLGTFDSVDVGFEYRETGAASWNDNGVFTTLNSASTVSDDITGLNDDTDYEYRLYVNDDDGTTYASSETVTTLQGDAEGYYETVTISSSADELLVETSIFEPDNSSVNATVDGDTYQLSDGENTLNVSEDLTNYDVRFDLRTSSTSIQSPRVERVVATDYQQIVSGTTALIGSAAVGLLLILTVVSGFGGMPKLGRSQ